MTPEGSARNREIVNARVIVTCPGRNFVTLQLPIARLADGTMWDW